LHLLEKSQPPGCGSTDGKELHFQHFFSLEMSLFQVSQVDEMQYLGRCSKHYHHRPRTMKKLKEFRPQEKGF